ncbi:polyphenol oxidase II, chloroplastic-like [Ipomoea triloba]|uniref:polyphenol oxidase II, chloroplastic-like n=1 Tax=Ipomoea triloba TaxID=35885 RepID=UPI00125E8844|nr:polyphenol oxidase II, chloroplastic-like [Ipomoea triloba]
MASLTSACISTAPKTAASFSSAAASKRNRRFKVSCNAAEGGGGDGGESQQKFDRRDVLLGLGGLYGAASLGANPLASAAPIQAPVLSNCVVPAAGLPAGAYFQDCCPPVPAFVLPYQLPPVDPFALKIRPAAHKLDAAYIAKFERAIQLMKELPESDPRNFYQQAKVHCAYCNGGYVQPDSPNKEIQVHNSWLFFPFHRWYMYFFERIMGKLLGDPTFALPFWNWDSPAGMYMPSYVNNIFSPLYDQNRNQSFLTRLMDLAFFGLDIPLPDALRIEINLFLMYKTMVSNGGAAILFHGQPYRAGDDPGLFLLGAGSVENIPHGTVHRWTGDLARTPNGEDMGNFYSAARDPLFYCHHSNVDRMWTIWQQLGGAGRRCDFTDPDWLDASFIFYDENATAVRVRVGDCLDNQKMGYKYAFENLPWLDSKPVPAKTKRGFADASDAPSVESVFPLKLDKVVRVKVPRPRKSRTKEEKAAEEEILRIEGIEVSADQFAKFDVYLNDEDEEPTLEKLAAEYAGSFVNLPQNHHGSGKIRTSLCMGLNEVLEDFDCEDDDAVVVTLVPMLFSGTTTIQNIRIIYHS